VASDDDEAFNRAWDKRERKTFEDELGPAFAPMGPWAWPGRESVVSRNERRRVDALLNRDRQHRTEEQLREVAEAEVAEGRLTSLRDTAIGPTPEQLAQAERSGIGYDRFTPKLPNGSVATVTAYRRKHLGQVQRLVLSGVIDAEGFRDCLWYRNIYEKTGLSGNIGSVDYGREVFAAPQSRAMFADWQVEAQDMFRATRASIERVELALLDQVVLQDVPIWRAARASGAGWRNAKCIIAKAVHQLTAARETLTRVS